MNVSPPIPPPRDTWIDCLWLPRIIAKARLLNAGTLPPDYVEKFAFPLGVDGQFLKFFELTGDEIRRLAAQSDDAIVTCLIETKQFTPEKIAAWNEIAINLGRPGYPMAERFEMVLHKLYANTIPSNPQTVFEILEADEGIAIPRRCHEDADPE